MKIKLNEEIQGKGAEATKKKRYEKVEKRNECKKKKKNEKVFSTGDSNVVTHHSTNPAHLCLTSEFGWDRVFSHGYDRRNPLPCALLIWNLGFPASYYQQK